MAQVYQDAHDRGLAPTRVVSQRFLVAYSTAARWVSIARNDYRLLTKTQRGQAKA